MKSLLFIINFLFPVFIFFMIKYISFGNNSTFVYENEKIKDNIIILLNYGKIKFNNNNSIVKEEYTSYMHIIYFKESIIFRIYKMDEFTYKELKDKIINIKGNGDNILILEKNNDKRIIKKIQKYLL